jgi:translocator protein
MNFQFLQNYKLKKWGFLGFTTLTTAINALSILLPLNGKTTKSISDMYSTILTPAGWTFAIWSVIYICLFIIGILVATNLITFSSKGLLFYIFSSLLNCIWIFLWHFLLPIYSMIALILIVICNAFVYLELKKSSQGALRLGVTSAYLIYLGWTIVACIINITVVLKYFTAFSLGFNVGTTGITVLCIAMALNVFLAIREMNPTMSLVLLWATFGIADNQTDKFLLAGLGSIYTVLILFSVQAVREYYLDRKAKGKEGGLVRILREDDAN